MCIRDSVGTDAGIYESFDLAKTWKYHKNLPITQFYKVAVNNAYPFYHIFGGKIMDLQGDLQGLTRGKVLETPTGIKF